MIRNKYNISCCTCGRLVLPGGGFIENTNSGWRGWHQLCGKKSPQPQHRIPLWHNEDGYEWNIEEMTESEFFGGDIGDK